MGGQTLRGVGGLRSPPPLSAPVLAQVSLLPPGDDGASLEKEARRWATRVARDLKNKAHSEEVGAVLPPGARGELKEGLPLPLASSHLPSKLRVPTQVLQQLEARRQQVPEAEAAAVERRVEEARENIRKAEVGPSGGRRLRVASRSVTPGLGVQGWEGVEAGVALPPWQPCQRPGMVGLAALCPHPIGVPLGVDNVCASPGQPSEG